MREMSIYYNILRRMSFQIN